MIKNKRKLERFYQSLLKKEHFSYQEALAIYEALHQEAVSLGAINSKNILDGLEANLRIAMALNSLKTKRQVPSIKSLKNYIKRTKWVT